MFSVVRNRWSRLSSARRDLAVISAVGILAWLVIERTDTCDRVFAWVADNPDTEVDSLILAAILASIGIAIFAMRRYREMLAASQARDTAEQQIRVMAYHDPLTGLPNRRALVDRLDALCAGARHRHAALIIIDLDRFKGVNDLHGHIAGDRLLMLVAERLRGLHGPRQTSYRLGGDEFAVVVELDQLDLEAPQLVARRIVHVLGERFESDNLIHHIGCSAGISLLPGDATETDALIRAADVALYRAKAAGRGQHRSYETAMDDQIRMRAQLEQEMRIGILHGEFVPFFQPIVDLATGATAGFELLARWRRDGAIVANPEMFIPIAEECGLITEITLQMLEQTCREARDWDPALTIAVNISPVQLTDPWLAEKLLKVLTANGFPPSRLAIELTESAIVADEQGAQRTIQSLKNQGMKLGLDDFGTGYASLHHLLTLPFDKIKIDKSFVARIQHDKDALMIVKAIIGLARSLDLLIVAEGIESAKVAAQLLKLGCAEGQGYLYGHAISGAETSTTRSTAVALVGDADAPAEPGIGAAMARSAAAR